MPRLTNVAPAELRPGDQITTSDDSDLIPPLDRVEVTGDGDDRLWLVYLGEGQPGPFQFTAEHRLTVERPAVT